MAGPSTPPRSWDTASSTEMKTIKEFAAVQWAAIVDRQTRAWATKPFETQQRTLEQLMRRAASTAFGRDHRLADVRSHEELVQAVPVRDYEALRPYIDRVVAGESDVMWPGRPTYFAKTSGTTSGAKYIPLTKESVPYHISSARNALFAHMHATGQSRMVNGNMIFLQGSPVLEDQNGVPTGRLSGITAHFVPSYLQKNRKPTWETNCIEDWEEKVEAVVRETVNAPMSIISGIPPWVQMYFERLLEVSGKSSIGEVFPALDLFVTGGVAFEPYRARFEELFGRKVPIVQTYPASEGFIAYQDRPDSQDLLLLLDNGMYYEFIPADRYFDENPPRLSLAEVQTGVNYALVMHTNAGLWGYSIGDTVEFVSTAPFRIRVSGRIKHFISAFGEHVIGSEVEYALEQAVKAHGGKVREFTVAPQVNPAEGGLPYHEWFVAFDEQPADLEAFTATVDRALQAKNVYYQDLISGGILRNCVLRVLPSDAFITYMKSVGKLGGQNKVPRLMNDRSVADKLAART